MNMRIHGRQSHLARIVRIGLLIALSPLAAAQSPDDSDCGDPYAVTIGPFDYTDPVDVAQKIPVVEQYHFNSDVENLVKGQTSAYIMQDLDYVLRAVPNHHRALYSVARYQLKTRQVDPRYRSAECYFDRAMRFRPNDATVRLIHGIFLARKGDKVAALAEYKAALEIDPGSAEAHYNSGLLYLEMKDFDNARAHAHKAYELGYPLQGLKRKLERAGEWREPAPSTGG